MPEAVFTPGKLGNALQFKNPANTGTVNVPHAEHLQFDANSFTISLWIQLTNGNSNYNASAGKDCYLMHKGQFTDPGGKWYGLQLKDSVLTFAIDDASAKTNVDVSLKKATAFHIFNNNWSHIMAVKDTSVKQIRLYINGVLAGSKVYTTTGTTDKALPLRIGNSPENKPFHDWMDDVRLYNYALSSAELDGILCRSILPAPSISVSRTDPTYTGGNANTIYLGYGAQQLTLTASYATPAQFSWSPGAGLSDSTIANPVFTPTQAGAYTFAATATNEFGCSATDSVTLQVIDVRCGNKQNKVSMCVYGHEICVDKIAVPILLFFRATLGDCPTTNGVITSNGTAHTQDISLRIFPVPASNNCTVQFALDEPGQYRVEIYNAHGQLMQVAGKGQANAHQLLTVPVNSSRFTAGVYYVKLITQRFPRGRGMKPMIIQR